MDGRGEFHRARHESTLDGRRFERPRLPPIKAGKGNEEDRPWSARSAAAPGPTVAAARRSAKRPWSNGQSPTAGKRCPWRTATRSVPVLLVAKGEPGCSPVTSPLPSGANTLSSIGKLCEGVEERSHCSRLAVDTSSWWHVSGIVIWSYAAPVRLRAAARGSSLWIVARLTRAQQCVYLMGSQSNWRYNA
jgi:hypothetical protein